MSNMSKALFFAATIFLLASYIVFDLKTTEILKEFDNPPEGISKDDWGEMLSHIYSTDMYSYDTQDVIIVSLAGLSLACVICAILFWKRNKPLKIQKLFSD